MAKHISEDTQITLDLKTIGLAVTGLGALISMWFVLQADIAEAKELPEPAAPEITRMEFDMKDQLVRQTIMSTQEDVTEIKQDIKRIEEKIDQLKLRLMRVIRIVTLTKYVLNITSPPLEQSPLLMILVGILYQV